MEALGLSAEHKVLDAIRVDEEEIVIRLDKLVCDKAGQISAQALRDDMAQHFLNIAFQVSVTKSTSFLFTEYPLPLGAIQAALQ